LAALITENESEDIAKPFWPDYANPSEYRRLRSRLLASGAHPSTVNVTFSALRGLLARLRTVDLISPGEFQLISEIGSIPESRQNNHRAVTTEDLESIFYSCEADPSIAGARDAALVAVFYNSGLRVNEVAALRVENYDAKAASLNVHQGDDEEELYLSISTQSALNDWIAHRGTSPGSLFTAIVGNRPHRTDRHMSHEQLRRIVTNRARQAGVGHLSPGDLRSAHQKHMEEARRRAMQRMHVPYLSVMERRAREV
jgi:integrase